MRAIYPQLTSSVRTRSTTGHTIQRLCAPIRGRVRLDGPSGGSGSLFRRSLVTRDRVLLLQVRASVPGP